MYLLDNPGAHEVPPNAPLQSFEGIIHVHHSATATFYSPSELCGVGGLHCERIRSSPSFQGVPRRDTVFVELDATKPGLPGMVIARVLLFFSITYRRVDYSCALVNWFLRDDDVADEDTGMWTVRLEKDRWKQPVFEVINVDSIVRGAHLLPIFGTQRVPERFLFHEALDRYKSFFVNHFVDHHVHELITG